MKTPIDVIRRPLACKAIRWMADGSNAAEVLQFLKRTDPAIEKCDDAEVIASNGDICSVAVRRGEWVVFTEEGEFRVFDDDEFNNEYGPVTV